MKYAILFIKVDFLEEKIQNFIDKEGDAIKRPLSSHDAQKAIIELKNAGMTFSKIAEFLKQELNITVSAQAIAKKYKSISKE